MEHVVIFTCVCMYVITNNVVLHLYFDIIFIIWFLKSGPALSLAPPPELKFFCALPVPFMLWGAIEFRILEIFWVLEERGFYEYQA